MPLSSPVGGGLDASQFLLRQTLYSTTDSSMSMSAMSYDPDGDRWLFGGTLAECGEIANADIYGGKIQGYAALPSTVITSGQVSNIIANSIDGGIIARIGNGIARSADGGASWVDISGASGTQVIQTWNNAYIFTAISGADIQYSNDNGATWNTIAFGGINLVCGTKASETALLAFAGQTNIRMTNEPDPILAADWFSFDISTLGIAGSDAITQIAADPTGTYIVATSQFGEIVYSSDGGTTFTRFPRADNPFQYLTSNFNECRALNYVADLDGFMMASTLVTAFMPKLALSTIQVGSFLGATGPSFASAARAMSASNGTDFMLCAGANTVYTMARPAT